MNKNEQDSLQVNRSVQCLKNVWIIIVLFFIVVLIVFMLGKNWCFKKVKQTLQKQVENLVQEQVKDIEHKQLNLNNVSNQIQKFVFHTYSDKYEIIFRQNCQDANSVDVYLKNLDCNVERFFMTIADVNYDLAYLCEYYNGNLYILRTFKHGENQYEELWKYDSQKKGTKLYSAKSFTFRVAPNEKYIAIRHGHYYEKLSIINQDNDIVHTYTLSDLGFDISREPMIKLLKWSSDSMQFWGDLQIGPYPLAFYKIDVDLWSIDKYDVSDFSLGCEYSLNGNNGKIVYSDYPVIFDDGTLEEYKKSGKEVDLVVFDLKTKHRQHIATSITKKFAPKWINESILEYNNPNSEIRVQKIIE